MLVQIAYPVAFTDPQATYLHRPHRRNTSTLPVMQRKILVIVAPEIAVDSWSMCVLLDELRTLYTSQSHDATIELPLVEMQYDEYLVSLSPPSPIPHTPTKTFYFRNPGWLEISFAGMAKGRRARSRF